MTSIGGLRVLVTGGSRGIGAATVRAVTDLGARCAFVARDPRDAARVAEQTGAVAIHADLADPAQATEAVRAAASSLRGIDCLVNNAGSFHLGHVADGVYADWRTMVDVNVVGLLVATQAAIPYLRDSERGHIINVSSLSGRRVASSTTGVYAGTKHAVHAISEGLRRELHDSGVRVTVIAPGVVATNFGAYVTDPDVRAAAKTSQENWGLEPRAVADQIAHVLTAPPDVHITEIALMSSRQPPG